MNREDILLKRIKQMEEKDMNLTSEQRDFLTVIMNNKVVLEELLEAVSTQQKQAKDLQMKESIIVAGITWSKFAEDIEGNAYMLVDENICTVEFGENNDWRESSIRKKLNKELYQEIVADLGADALITIQTDLFSHDGLRCYGECEDMVSLLTYDLYRNNRNNIKSSGEWFWTCTPDSALLGKNDSFVRCVSSVGGVGYSDCGYSLGVRPFFILKSDIFVSYEEVEG